MTSATSAHGYALQLLKMKETARLQIDRLVPGSVAKVWQRLADRPLHLDDLESEFPEALPDLYLLLQTLWAHRAVALMWPAGNPEVEISAAIEGEVLDLGICSPEKRWKLSRFAYLHADDSGQFVVETPRSAVQTVILNPRIVPVLATLCAPKDIPTLLAELKLRRATRDIQDLLSLLWAAGVITQCDDQGQTDEEKLPELAQWEAQDLLFHMRSRQGRHAHPMGAQFRFRGRISPQPAVKPNPWQASAIPLPKFDLQKLSSLDPPFTAVLELRRSTRAMDFSRPITLSQIAEFLFRSARVRHRFQTDIGEFTSRPYPNGGASYEFELYLAINACADLERGFYYYDPESHSLSLVARPDIDMEGLLDDAWTSSARQCRPQVLITVASRFHRVSWKYSGIAYAAQLKNVGALYQTFYLVATAMNLAGCGLGLGDATRFARLTKISYFEEGSVGEFMLGTPA